MKRAAILTVAIIAVAIFALWMRGNVSVKHLVPVDVVIDHIPYCAQQFTITGHTATIKGLERGVCTTRNVIRN